GVRIQGQARRSRAAPRDRRPVPAAYRLADLVRRHVGPRTLPLDGTPDLEAASQRRGCVESSRQQPVSRSPSAFHPRPVLSLRVRAARQPRGPLLAPHAPRQLDPAAVGGRPAPSSLPHRPRLATCRRAAVIAQAPGHTLRYPDIEAPALRPPGTGPACCASLPSPRHAPPTARECARRGPGARSRTARRAQGAAPRATLSPTVGSPSVPQASGSRALLGETPS